MFEIPKNDLINDVIKEHIDRFMGSHEYCMLSTGESYYKSENTKIMDRKKLMYMRDNNGADYLVNDPYKANNKLASGFYKILIDQKVQYSLGKPVSVKSGKVDILSFFGKDFPKVLKCTGKAASKNGIGWAQVYMDEFGQFKLMRIPSGQCIPVYSDIDADELAYVIRHYEVSAKNSQGVGVRVIRAELWDETQVCIFQQNADTKLYSLIETRSHFVQQTTLGETVQDQQDKSWGKVPFIPFYSNDERIYDLQPVKRYIDVYDIVESDFANNLEDLQDVYWVLRGYNGENIDTFLAEVRRYKTLKVSEDGGAEAKTIEIPTVARNALLDRLKADIFLFGRGVDPTQTGDGNITNIVIKSRFAALDLKAAEFEQECKDFIDRVIFFLNVYLGMDNKPAIEKHEVTFNRSLIINETELLAANASQQGSVSEETRLTNHPWVSDVEEEKRCIEAERQPIALTERADPEGEQE